MEDSPRCVNCNNTFTYNVKRKRYNRTGLFSKCGTGKPTPAESLQHTFGVDVTPGVTPQRFMCEDCECLLRGGAVDEGKKFRFRKVRHSGSYVAQKLASPTVSPSPVKKRQNIGQSGSNVARRLEPIEEKQEEIINIPNSKTGKAMKKLLKRNYVSGKCEQINRIFSFRRVIRCPLFVR